MDSSRQEVRSAFITGAARGIGAAFARRLATDKAVLWLVDKDSEALTALAEELRTAGAVVELIIADLSSPGGQDLIVSALTEQKQLDLLINNAGFGKPDLFHEQPEESSWKCCICT
jgi:short-subunit dehydrogenase